MVWISVDNDALQEFLYTEYGMETPATVTDNRKAQVSQEVADALFEHHPDSFSPTDDEDDEEDDGDAETADEEDEADEDDAGDGDDVADAETAGVDAETIPLPDDDDDASDETEDDTDT